MASELPRAILEIKYDEAAREYLRKLPPEHHMEAITQSTQRKITVESLDLVHARRPEIQIFSELLIQYPLPRRRKLGQVVPDNIIVLSHQPIRATTSFNVPLEPAAPFWVMEYVSKGNKRKDYEKSFQKYEQELRVPYYLVFYPDNQELSLFHLVDNKYTSVRPNAQGRYAIPELELELGLIDGWIRYWWQGQMLPLPAELQASLDAALQQAKRDKERADSLERQLNAKEQTIRALEAELARLRANPMGNGAG